MLLRWKWFRKLDISKKMKQIILKYDLYGQEMDAKWNQLFTESNSPEAINERNKQIYEFNHKMYKTCKKLGIDYPKPIH